MANDPLKPIPSSGPNSRPAAAPTNKFATAKTATTSFLSYLFVSKSKPGEIIVYRHSSLFYWWPVWFFGFIMFIFTYFNHTHMALVPAGTEPTTASEGKAPIHNKLVDISNRDILVLAEKKTHITRKDDAGQNIPIEPTIYVAHQKTVGTTFVIVLLLVIAITNIQMRGLWSFFVLLLIVMFAILFAVAGWWDAIFTRLGQLSIHINMGGYVVISGVLFVLWLVNFAFLDRQIYMIFTSGQVRVCLEIGGGETVYDAAGMTIQKQRSDLFRHWILGFGSGDLVIRPAGLAHPIEMPNVLRVGRTVRQIEELMKEKVVVQ